MKIAFSITTIIFLFVGCQSQRVAAPNTVSYSDSHLEYKKWDRTPQCCFSRGKRFAIASGGAQASAAGGKMYDMGGNIIDAAVATAFVLAVERPRSLGLGGGGFLTLHLAKDPQKDYFVDFRETAPHRASRNMYLDKLGEVKPKASLDGPLSIGTPGFVAGLWEIHQKWGKLSWNTVLSPAIELADAGIRVTPHMADAILFRKEPLSKEVYTRNLLFPRGKPLQVGALFKQKDLARSLRLIAAGGRSVFYEGILAKKMAKHIRLSGGILSLKDLSHYHTKWRRPVSGKFHQYRFIAAPPPSAGGILFSQMFQMLEGFDFVKMAEQSHANYTHLLTEVMAQAYAGRSEYIGDTEFFPVDIKGLTSARYTRKLQGRISLSRHTPSQAIKPVPLIPKRESASTTHLSIMDHQGNALAMTLSINFPFGSGIAVPGTGIFMNDTMDDFSAKPGIPNIYGLTGGEGNAISPLRRPVSSMTPTIVFEGSKPILAVGAAGGSRIMSHVFQVIVNYLYLFPGQLKKALFAPRMHFQWVPDKLFLESPGYQVPTLSQLETMGHKITAINSPAKVQAVGYQNKSAQFSAVFDPRDHGGAVAK